MKGWIIDERIYADRRSLHPISASHRHHTHITDIAANAINVIIIMVESLSDESLTCQKEFDNRDPLTW